MAIAAAPGVNLGYCNPYGAETGGPRHVLGGLYGPASARTPDLHLPQSVAEGEWPCANRAEIRCRMICGCGHKGQAMALCSWHDEVTYSGEYTAGSFRQVKKTVRVRGHFEEIQRRQSGSCPRCLWPAELAAVQKEADILARQLAIEAAAGRWYGPRAEQIRQRAEQIGQIFDGRRVITCRHCHLPKYAWDQSGCNPAHRPVNLARDVHNCALRLIAVS